MTLDEMSDRYPVLLALIAITIWVSTMATLKLLFWLKKYKPEKLEQVGISTSTAGSRVGAGSVYLLFRNTARI